jgi:hypothetical protein
MFANYHLLEYIHWVHVGYIYIYIYIPIFSKLIYHNQMYIQRYINLKKYTHFITLDIS